MTDLPNTGGHTNRKILKLEIEIPRQPSRQCNGGMMMMTMILSYFVRCCCCCCTYKHRGIMHLVFSASNRHSTYFPLPSVCRHIPSTVQRSHLPLILPSTSLLYCRFRYWRWRWRWCLSLHASPSNQPFLPSSPPVTVCLTELEIGACHMPLKFSFISDHIAPSLTRLDVLSSRRGRALTAAAVLCWYGWRMVLAKESIWWVDCRALPRETLCNAM